jgi:hypothetical protein
MYLATPQDIADRMKATAAGRGDTILYEHKQWTSRAHGAGTVDEIPASWKFSIERLAEVVALARA